MRTSKIIKKLAKKEGVSVEFVKAEILKAIDMADWNKINPNGAKPKSIQEAMLLVKQQVDKI